MTPSKILGCDLDGLLAEYDGWKGIDHIGKPRENWVYVIEYLHDRGVRCNIQTCRLNPFAFSPDRCTPLEEIEQSRQILSNWLRDNGLAKRFYNISGTKLYADLYVDDRIWGFEQLDRMPKEELAKTLYFTLFKEDLKP
jgi:hypothetical protein